MASRDAGARCTGASSRPSRPGSRRHGAVRTVDAATVSGRRSDRRRDPVAPRARLVGGDAPRRLPHRPRSRRLVDAGTGGAARRRRRRVVAPRGRRSSTASSSAPPRVVDLIVGHDRRVATPIGARVNRRRGDVNRSVDERHWPWRTTLEETILDISMSASVDETFALLGRAFQRRLTTEEALRGRLSLRARHPRRELLQLVLGDVAAGAESAMEIRYVRDVERAHGLPTGVRQFSPRRDGYQLHDIGYAEQRVLVELDGRLGHEGLGRAGQGRDSRSSWRHVRMADDAGVLARRRRLSVRPGLDTGAILASRGWRVGYTRAVAGPAPSATVFRGETIGGGDTEWSPHCCLAARLRPDFGVTWVTHTGSSEGYLEQESPVARSPARMNGRRVPD